MNSSDTLLQVLSGLVACGSRASTASAIAKRISTTEGGGKCSTQYVEEVIAVLDKLPYVEVLRKPSGRLAGLEFKPKTEGTCSIYYVRVSPGYTQYFHGSKLAARVEDREDFKRNLAAQAELEAVAAQNHWPVLNFLRRDFLEKVHPFVKEALAAAAN
jgi:hypothetical protein